MSPDIEPLVWYSSSEAWLSSPILNDLRISRYEINAIISHMKPICLAYNESICGMVNSDLLYTGLRSINLDPTFGEHKILGWLWLVNVS